MVAASGVRFVVVATVRSGQVGCGGEVRVLVHGEDALVVAAVGLLRVERLRRQRLEAGGWGRRTASVALLEAHGLVDGL